MVTTSSYPGHDDDAARARKSETPQRHSENVEALLLPEADQSQGSQNTCLHLGRDRALRNAQCCRIQQLSPHALQRTLTQKIQQIQTSYVPQPLEDVVATEGSMRDGLEKKHEVHKQSAIAVLSSRTSSTGGNVTHGTRPAKTHRTDPTISSDMASGPAATSQSLQQQSPVHEPLPGTSWISVLAAVLLCQSQPSRLGSQSSYS